MTTRTEPVPTPKLASPQKGLVWKQRLEKSAVYLIIGGMVIFSLTPFVWPVLSAFTTKPENVSGLYLYQPASLTLKHFREAIVGRGEALVLLRNSFITAGGAILIAIVVCTLGGYTLSRMRFRFKRPLMYGILLVQIIPFTATVLPYYLIMREMQLVNTLLGVTLGLATSQIPFVMWVMKGFFDAVPVELEEAACLDGASRLQALVYVIFPLALPGVGAAGVLAFNSAWGQFFLPLILLSSSEKFVLPLGLFRAIIGYTNIDFGMMNAMAFIYMTPTLIFFLFARRYLIRGVMAGAMAGK